MTPEQAQALAQPFRWTIQALIDKLPDVNPWWMRDAVVHFDGDGAELEARIVALMEAQQHELPRVYMGLVLFFLGHALGKVLFIQGLRSADARVRQLVLDQFRIFRPDDLGEAGGPGKLPVRLEEVYAAIVPFLKEPASREGSIALDFALGHGAFDMGRTHTRALLRHPSPTIRDKVLTAYLERGVDDGAIGVLAGELLDPAIGNREKSEEWRRARWNDCRSLRYGAEGTKDAVVRQRAGDLALQVLVNTTAAPDLATRVNGLSGGWVDTDELLRVIAASRPAGADAVLQVIVDEPTAPVSFRSHALLRLFELTGRAGRNADAVVDAMVREDKAGSLDDRLSRLVACGIARLDTLVLAVRNPSWTYEATQAINSWPRGADDARAVSGLIDALRIFGSAMPGSAVALDCVVATLHLLSRTAQDDAAAIAALRVALTSAERSTDQPWVVQRVMRHLLLFGDLSVADAGGLDPWNAMWAHWKSNRWSWADVARSLVEAGAIDPADESRLNEAEQSSKDITDFFTTLISPEGARVVFSGIRDDGYELHHHRLFGGLVAAVRPPLEVQALSQSWDHQLAEVPPSETKSMRYLRIVEGETQWAPLGESIAPVYSTEGTTCIVHFVHANEVYGFLTQPNGTWMDVWGVVDAFDSFMRAHGRPERAYCLADPPSWNGEYLLFLTAPADRFGAIAARLRLPLRQREG